MEHPSAFTALRAAGLTVERLTAGDKERVGDLCRRTTEFFELVEGRPGSERTAVEILEVGPPGIELARKLVLGLGRQGRLVGLIDLIDGYPTPGTWCVGLLVLDPNERGRGLGRVVWSDTEAYIRQAGGQSATLVVQTQNARARRFWEARGFTLYGEAQQVLASATNQVWRFRKTLGVAAQPGVPRR